MCNFECDYRDKCSSCAANAGCTGCNYLYVCVTCIHSDILADGTLICTAYADSVFDWSDKKNENEGKRAI